jgi:hypothetical protein
MLAHDEYTGPNLRALRRIMAALFISAALCFTICLTLIVHDKPVRHRPVRKASPCPCACSTRQ